MVMGKDVHRYNTTIIKANLYLTRTDERNTA